MRTTRSRPDRHASRRWTLWLLLRALVLQGHTAAVAQLLGPLHHHEGGGATRGALAEAAHDGLDRWQTWQRDLQARSGATGLLNHAQPGHRHGLFERHDRNDASVVTSGCTTRWRGRPAA